jgi:hypothetical protein
VFSLFDARAGFWQVKLDQESSMLTTFITPYGRYRYLRVPFGLNCAPEAFQMAIEKVFADIEPISPYFDDILVATPNTQEHCIHLRKMLEAARKGNLKLNSDKMSVAVDKVRYLGHMLTENGIQADPQKLHAITNYPTPESREDLMRFLGMATYLLKFVPNFSQKTACLRQLLKKGIEFVWDSNAQKCFNELKQVFVQPPVLKYFARELPIVLSVDASSHGLGAVLLQNEMPVAFASVSLNETQSKTYSQIEKELLAITFALEKFHYYVYGRSVEVQTDHKPLLGLVDKPYQKVSSRLQRMLMRLQ